MRVPRPNVHPKECKGFRITSGQSVRRSTPWGPEQAPIHHDWQVQHPQPPRRAKKDVRENNTRGRPAFPAGPLGCPRAYGEAQAVQDHGVRAHGIEEFHLLWVQRIHSFQQPNSKRNPIAMASNLLAMASNLVAMASNLNIKGGSGGLSSEKKMNVEAMEDKCNQRKLTK